MSQTNKAFVVVTDAANLSTGVDGCRIDARAAGLAPDNSGLATGGSTTFSAYIDYSDTSHQVREKIAAACRVAFNDASLEVMLVP